LRTNIWLFRTPPKFPTTCTPIHNTNNSCCAGTCCQHSPFFFALQTHGGLVCVQSGAPSYATLGLLFTTPYFPTTYAPILSTHSYTQLRYSTPTHMHNTNNSCCTHPLASISNFVFHDAIQESFATVCCCVLQVCCSVL